MARSLDVAAYIVDHIDHPIDGVSLQKLTYLVQAWFLAWEGRPLYEDPSEAWPQGPVVRDVWLTHHHRRVVTRVAGGNGKRIFFEEAAHIDDVLSFYANMDKDTLVDKSHDPAWYDARGDLLPKAPSNAHLSHALIAEYYAGLDGSDEPIPRRRPRSSTHQRTLEGQELRMQAARWKTTFEWLNKHDR